MTTYSDSVVSEQSASLVDVTLNDVLQDQLALQTNLHRVWWNAPVFTLSGTAGACVWSIEWFAGYGEAPQTNDQVTLHIRIVSGTGGIWHDDTFVRSVPQVIREPVDAYAPVFSPGVSFILETAEIYTPDGWIDHAANEGTRLTCPS